MQTFITLVVHLVSEHMASANTTALTMKPEIGKNNNNNNNKTSIPKYLHLNSQDIGICYLT